MSGRSRLPCSCRALFTQCRWPVLLLELLLHLLELAVDETARTPQVSARGGWGWKPSGLFRPAGRVAGSPPDSRSAAWPSRTGCVGQGQGLLGSGRELSRTRDRQWQIPATARATASTAAQRHHQPAAAVCGLIGWSMAGSRTASIKSHQGMGAWLTAAPAPPERRALVPVRQGRRRHPPGNSSNDQSEASQRSR